MSIDEVVHGCMITACTAKETVQPGQGVAPEAAREILPLPCTKARNLGCPTFSYFFYKTVIFNHFYSLFYPMFDEMVKICL